MNIRDITTFRLLMVDHHTNNKQSTWQHEGRQKFTIGLIKKNILESTIKII